MKGVFSILLSATVKQRAKITFFPGDNEFLSITLGLKTEVCLESLSLLLFTFWQKWKSTLNF